MRRTLQIDVHLEASTEKMRGDTGFQLCKYIYTEMLPVLPCYHFAEYYSFPEKKSVSELNDQPSYVQYNRVHDVEICKFSTFLSRLYIRALILRTRLYTFLNFHVLIRLFAFRTQHTVESNNMWRRLRQWDVVKNLTQNFKHIKFHFLPTTKMKKIISHITLIVKLIKISHFNIIQSYRHD